MAVRGLGSTSTKPGNPADFVFFASGGTLDSSNTVQLNFDDSVYGASNEGKQRLANAVRALADRLEAAKVWPVTTSS